MELRHLRYFVAVAEERNFTRAAERLHMAQPPLSRSIQQLEETLEVQLFQRDSRPLKLPETGKFFYPHALQWLAQTPVLESTTDPVKQAWWSSQFRRWGLSLAGYMKYASCRLS